MTNFSTRHIGISESDAQNMLTTLKATTLNELIDETIPQNIRLKQALNLPNAISEYQYLQHIEQIAQQNQFWKTYIGAGYYGTITPTVIQRNIFENPGWYTQYTPYQAEIAQGRLEALLNFQTMVSDLTGLPVASASLLDEATAAAEAMQMMHRIHNKNARNYADYTNIFLVSDTVLPSTIDVLLTRSQPLGIEIIIDNPRNFIFSNQTFGCLLQYPNQLGNIENYTQLVINAKLAGAMVAVATDLMALTLLTPPGEWGADIAIGNSQRFGVPLCYGGPHAAFFATRLEYIRQTPGRIIGVSLDAKGNQAYRMTLQTREQHIKREKATSNICTAQALLAIMASMYGVYHGPTGLKKIAQQIHHLTLSLEKKLIDIGYNQINTHFFDTLLIDVTEHPNTSSHRIQRIAELEEVNFRYFDDKDQVGIALNETTTENDINLIAQIFADALSKPAAINTAPTLENEAALIHKLPSSLLRTSMFLTHPVFNTHHSETEMLRYIKQLENKDLSLAQTMIPLGSCTMKLNATTQLIPLSWANFANLHPFIPKKQAQGYLQIISELEKYLCEITGFFACSLQPNSGAQGEYAGLLAIRNYLIANKQQHRNIALIPSSAHGTNPASAIMAGMQVIVVKCDDNGNIDVTDLKIKAEQHSHNLAALLVTYPSTHGVFESKICEICEIIHANGGQVYMDGANMNAQVGLTQPAIIGADVCHLNLHKTFAIPHGGGGPGMGPICVAAHLAPYLPSHITLQKKQAGQAFAVSAAPFGSAGILLISYAYIKLLGNKGLTDATKYAILNANYIKNRLLSHFDVLYVGENGRVAHELIIDLRPFKQTANIEAEDVAKRLIDYGFHAPTVSFPVAGTLMIEPTESENKAEIDRFCDALIAIRNEIATIENGTTDPKNNTLKNAPHTIYDICNDNWNYPYSRQQAAYPLPYLKKQKFWSSVNRVDNAYGDRNIICSCPPTESYT